MTPPVANPARAEGLASRYEPNLMLEKHDEFWPVAVRTVDLLRLGQKRTCFATEKGALCKPAHIRDLPWASGSGLAYLDYPADNSDPEQERDGVAAALKSGAPGTAARIYYYVTGRDPDRPVTLQYWFFFPFNYLEAHSPFGLASVNTDLHEGDIEGMSILLSAHKRQPVYVWMPRHRDEGERFTWNEGALQRNGDHPVGFAAKGSHATYESCGRKFRSANVHGVNVDIPDDYFSCRPSADYELGSTIPALDLARTWWACWPGHLGYAPHLSSPWSEFHADGPTSPLYQQKFDLRNPQPCAGVEPPAPPELGKELLTDPETASALGQAGGRLNELFRNCDDWWQRPPEGSYMVACDQKTLDAFFASGLEDGGDQNLRIGGRPARHGPMVPAVLAAPTPPAGAPQGVDRATIRTDRTAHPEVFVAVRAEDKLRVARFPELTLSPGQDLRLRRDSNSVWRLIDAADGGRTVAEAGVHETGASASPQKPVIVSAERNGNVIELHFGAGTNPETSLIAYAGADREDLLEGGRSVGKLSGQLSGNYELTIEDPDHAIQQVRVVAFNEGALAASALVAISEGD
ncbi:MAG TPA: hypothetical protein VN758_01010 [Solirubrobacterales bacterium]|nr:hypothetical protein [Solirubrobacterales bacterium]